MEKLHKRGNQSQKRAREWVEERRRRQSEAELAITDVTLRLNNRDGEAPMHDNKSRVQTIQPENRVI